MAAPPADPTPAPPIDSAAVRHAVRGLRAAGGGPDPVAAAQEWAWTTLPPAMAARVGAVLRAVAARMGVRP